MGNRFKTIAIVLTACGIETYGMPMAKPSYHQNCNSAYRLRYWNLRQIHHNEELRLIAIVLTACGIETKKSFCSGPATANCNSAYRLRYWNVLQAWFFWRHRNWIAIVLTACGIETGTNNNKGHKYIPIAIVLTACGIETSGAPSFTNKNKDCNSAYRLRYWNILLCNYRLRQSIAIVLTACGIETNTLLSARYATLKIAIVLTACGIETLK